MHAWFDHIARRCAHWMGTAHAFIGSCVLVLVWAVLGPFFAYSDSWQLVINTSTTILTFLMVFLIQNTQNNDSRAVHIKLDEIIHSLRAANNQIIAIEDLTEAQLLELGERYRRVRERCDEATSP
jgi:low affinity Fe/Cu permease